MPHKLLKRFTERFFPAGYDNANSPMPRLVAEGQTPEYFIISCADSRCDPGTIFDAEPGSFFGFKSIGAIVRPYKTGTALAASLQYAINVLEVKKLILLGHTHCGAIKALHDKTDDPEISSFIDVAHEAMDQARHIAKETPEKENEDALLRLAEQQVLLASAKNLLTYPAVKKAVESGKLTIQSWIFEMEGGNILSYDISTSQFKTVTRN